MQQEIENVEITDQQIQAIYMYLEMHYDQMETSEKIYWNLILEKIDPEYHDNED
jgi:hypothetical protein